MYRQNPVVGDSSLPILITNSNLELWSSFCHGKPATVSLAPTAFVLPNNRAEDTWELHHYWSNTFPPPSVGSPLLSLCVACGAFDEHTVCASALLIVLVQAEKLLGRGGFFAVIPFFRAQ